MLADLPSRGAVPAALGLAPSVAHMQLWWDLTWPLLMLTALAVVVHRLGGVIGALYRTPVGPDWFRHVAALGRLIGACTCLLVLSYVLPS